MGYPMLKDTIYAFTLRILFRFLRPSLPSPAKKAL